MDAATTALAAPALPLDHSEIMRFVHAIADERLTGLEQATLDERRAAAHAVINQIQAIEQAVPAAAGGAALVQFNPLYVQALGFTTVDPVWARSALTLMLRVIYMYSARFLLSDNHYRMMYRSACDWGARLRTLYPTVDFGNTLPQVSATSSTIALGDLPMLHILFAFPILNQLYTVVCRDISPLWVHLGEEQRLAGFSPSPTDGNGWACFFAACCQRHMEVNVSRDVVTDRRAAAQRAGITAGMTPDDVRLWMTTDLPVATPPTVASAVIDTPTRNNAGEQPASHRGDSLNLLYLSRVDLSVSKYEQCIRADSRNELTVDSSSVYLRICICIGVGVYVCVDIFLYIYLCIYVCVHIYACVHVRTITLSRSTCALVCVCVFRGGVDARTWVWVCIWTHDAAETYIWRAYV
jgi:hypothetical protein